MSKNISKARMTSILAGTPKRVVRGTIARIVKLGDDLKSTGLCSFPYYSKTQPEHEAFRGSDTRRLLEREVGPFFYTTGNWEHLFEGHDTCVCWQDADLNEKMTEAGFSVRTVNTESRNVDPDDDPLTPVIEAESV